MTVLLYCFILWGCCILNNETLHLNKPFDPIYPFLEIFTGPWFLSFECFPPSSSITSIQKKKKNSDWFYHGKYLTQESIINCLFFICGKNVSFLHNCTSRCIACNNSKLQNYNTHMLYQNKVGLSSTTASMMAFKVFLSILTSK